MSELTTLVRRGILKDLAGVREHCKKTGICKPHIHSAVSEVLNPKSPWGVEHLDYQALLELDQQFYGEQLKESFNKYDIAVKTVNDVKHEWFVRVPSWLKSGIMLTKADEVYRRTVLQSVYNDFFSLEAVPSYFDLVSVVKPSTHTVKKIDSHAGATTVKIALTPMLKPEEVVKVFQTVIGIKDHKNNVKMGSFSISLHPDLLNFLTTCKLPESNVDVMVAIASIAASPTPYSTVLEILRKALVDKGSMSKEVYTVLRAKASDLDIEFGAVSRMDGSKPLSNAKMLNLLNKKLAAAGLKSKVSAKDFYYDDYLMFEPIRYYEDHGKAMDNFLEKSNYFEQRFDAA
jgi:hypothetical protein